ncbi:MAG TPA: phytanoyl-CoA dioxygenase family protein [Mycobacteriales bacterium]|nr:phytanoyl-CoA dioxygenase family protein [Mycobacteriales bacterium]
MATSLETDGYVVLRRAVAPDAVAAALRLLNLAIRRYGLSSQEIVQCQEATFFPHLRWEPEVWGALPPGAAEALGWQEGDEWAEPQLLLRFPDEPQEWPLQPHIDAIPPWAGGRSYRGIVGVALTTSGEQDGCVHVWPGSHHGDNRRPPTPVPLEAGDALIMHPQLEHSGSLNLGPSIRTSIYFRLLGAAPTA